MRLRALHHVHVRVPDLAATRRFAEDFGLLIAADEPGRIYMRTGGGDAFAYVAEQGERRFRGIGFLAESIGDLEAAAALPGAGPIRALTSPGGGQGVTLAGPEGIVIEIVAGIAEASAAEAPALLRHNVPGTVQRHHDAQALRALAPAHLYRLGHVGIYVHDYTACAAWFRDTLGLIESDTIHTGDPEKTIVGFLRLDRGDEWVDHHAIFLVQFGKTDLHHASFEVQDYEAQFMAHRFLTQQGWTPNWGVGRHPLGSHVFDVWFDPSGYRFETFSDTDVVTVARAAGHHDIHDAHMDLWSSDSPERYFN